MNRNRKSVLSSSVDEISNYQIKRDKCFNELSELNEESQKRHRICFNEVWRRTEIYCKITQSKITQYRFIYVSKFICAKSII